MFPRKRGHQVPLRLVETQVTTLETGMEQQLQPEAGAVHPPLPLTDTVRLERKKAPLEGAGQHIAPTQKPPPLSEEVRGQNPKLGGEGGELPLPPPQVGVAAMSERELYKGFTP